MGDEDKKNTTSTAAGIAVALALVCLLVWMYWPAAESLTVCRGPCNNDKPSPGLVINPYIWPYSGGGCYSDIFTTPAVDADLGLNANALFQSQRENFFDNSPYPEWPRIRPGDKVVTPVSRRTPDHVELV